MLSIYEQTKQGQATRSHLLQTLQQQNGLTRNEIVQLSGLTYDQVRRQTRNLSITGQIESRMENGQFRYFLKRAVPQRNAAIVALFLVVWLPVL